jgi:hypothetical protein
MREVSRKAAGLERKHADERIQTVSRKAAKPQRKHARNSSPLIHPFAHLRAVFFASLRLCVSLSSFFFRRSNRMHALPACADRGFWEEREPKPTGPRRRHRGEGFVLRFPRLIQPEPSRPGGGSSARAFGASPSTAHTSFRRKFCPALNIRASGPLESALPTAFA